MDFFRNSHAETTESDERDEMVDVFGQLGTGTRCFGDIWVGDGAAGR